MKRLWMVMVGLFLLAGVFGLGSGIEAAEKYPVKPINFIVAVEAGADGDVICRPIVQRVSQMLGQPLVVVNKPGGGSSIGYREIHLAKPDGYTIGWASATIITNKLQGVSPFDYHDFTQLGTMATYYPIIVASNKTQRPFKTIQEVIAFAKANPGELSMATAGIGQSWWVAAMSFVEGTGLNVNMIPQPGAGAVTVAQVAGGHTDIGVVALGSAKSMIEGGMVRFLATLGSKRAPAPYDHIPTVRELGYDVSWESTNLVMGPPKLPKDITEILAKAFEKAINEPEYVKYVIERNALHTYMPPDQVVKFLDDRRTVVRRIMDKAGILKEK
jgi:putative tricarboxylic transport membrane protein